MVVCQSMYVRVYQSLYGSVCLYERVYTRGRE